MKKVILLCSFGMSTSLLVTKMKKVAEEHNLPIEIDAFSYSEADKIVNNNKPNCILLGPQIRYMFDEIKSKYEPLGIPVDIIDTIDYGSMNGEKVLKQAVRLIKGR